MSIQKSFSRLCVALVLLLSPAISLSDDYPLNWDWEKESAPVMLSEYSKAPNDIGIYEIGFLKNKVFEPMYVGRAVGVTLKARLATHHKNSHNKNINQNRDNLYFRTKVFKSKKIASYVEAVTIAAFEYPWNNRNEWKQHWALEN